MSVGQSHFTDAVFAPSQPSPAGLVNPDGVQARKRFDVYRNNVASSLTEALIQAFPVIHRLVGDEFFRPMAGLYLRQHPPRSALMMFYGAEMPEFLAQFEPVQQLPYLPDVARLELALRHSYHAADITPLSPDFLQQVETDKLMACRLTLAPAVRLIRSRWPIHGIWQWNMVNGAPKPATGGENVLITRPDLDPHMAVLPPGGGTFVAKLTEGGRFGDAYATAQSRQPDFNLGQTLGLLLSGGAIERLNEEPLE